MCLDLGVMGKWCLLFSFGKVAGQDVGQNLKGCSFVGDCVMYDELLERDVWGSCTFGIVKDGLYEYIWDLFCGGDEWWDVNCNNVVEFVWANPHAVVVGGKDECVCWENVALINKWGACSELGWVTVG